MHDKLAGSSVGKLVAAEKLLTVPVILFVAVLELGFKIRDRRCLTAAATGAFTRVMMVFPRDGDDAERRGEMVVNLEEFARCR